MLTLKNHDFRNQVTEIDVAIEKLIRNTILQTFSERPIFRGRNEPE